MNTNFSIIIISFFLTFSALSENKSEEPVVNIFRGEEDYPPFEMVENGKLTGFHVELIEAVAKEIGLKIKFTGYPWKRALLMMRYGEADAISFVSKNVQREKFMIFDEGNRISQPRFVFVTHKDSAETIKYNGTIDSIKNYYIGVQLGFYYGEKFSKIRFPYVYSFGTKEQMSHALASKRVDLIPINYYEYLGEKEKGLFEDTVALSPSFQTHNVYLAFAKKSKSISDKFAVGLKKFKNTKAYEELKQKYEIILDENFYKNSEEEAIKKMLDR